MPSPDEAETPSNPEVLAARGQVELAKAELESRLYQAGDSGRRALRRMAGKAKPALIAAAVVVGVVLVVRIVRSKTKRSAWPHVVVEDETGKPSFLKVALGAAVRGALRVVATRVTEQAVARLVTANEELPDEGPEPSVAPTTG
jgi:hypothetical protein